jgi:predicted nucleic acid-binding protein
MTHYYLDSSALIKRYVAEPGSDWLKVSVFEPDDVLLLTSRVTMVEVWSALARRQREASISFEHHADALHAFREDCLKQYRFVEFEEPVYELAGRLIARHPLHAYDAVQLASALVAGRTLTGVGLGPPVFLCADNHLLAVANTEGLVGINPSQHQ